MSKLIPRVSKLQFTSPHLAAQACGMNSLRVYRTAYGYRCTNRTTGEELTLLNSNHNHHNQDSSSSSSSLFSSSSTSRSQQALVPYITNSHHVGAIPPQNSSPVRKHGERKRERNYLLTTLNNFLCSFFLRTLTQIIRERASKARATIARYLC